MSQLSVTSTAVGAAFKLNCTGFSTMLFSQMSSVQTKTMQQHFPVKAQQPEVSFDLVFRSELVFETFQRFVRTHQVAALNSMPHPEVTLWWPERDVNNWTGLIRNFKAGGARFNPVPRARLTVDLIDSVFSQGAALASLASSFWTVAGYGSPSGMLRLPAVIPNVNDSTPGLTNTPLPGSGR